MDDALVVVVSSVEVVVVSDVPTSTVGISASSAITAAGATKRLSAIAADVNSFAIRFMVYVFPFMLTIVSTV